MGQSARSSRAHIDRHDFPARGGRSLASWLEDLLPHVDRLSRNICSRNGMSRAESDDCCATVHLRLVEHDYRILRQHQGQSSLRGYLAVVVQRLVIDYQRSAWGKWRPSAAALRRGPVAVALEELIERDRLPLEEATQILRQTYDLESVDLEAIAIAIPSRAHRRPVPLDEGDEPLRAPEGDPEHALLDAERSRRLAKAVEALRAELRELSSEDRFLFKMRHDENLPISEIARVLGVPQRPLYRRVPRIERHLASRLESHGFDPESVRELLTPPSG